MPNIILDTNVIVSGLVFGGKIKNILQAVFTQDVEMVSCDELEREVLRILVGKFEVSLDHLTLAKKLLKIAKTYTVKKPYPHISRDKNDNYLLGLIEISNAEILVTGDKDLLVLGSYKGCVIVKPSEFLETNNLLS